MIPCCSPANRHMWFSLDVSKQVAKHNFFSVYKKKNPDKMDTELTINHILIYINNTHRNKNKEKLLSNLWF